MEQRVYDSLRSFAKKLGKMDRQSLGSYSHRQIPLNESYSKLVKMMIKEPREAEQGRQ